MVQAVIVLPYQHTYFTDSPLIYNSQWPCDVRHYDLNKTPDDMTDGPGD